MRPYLLACVLVCACASTIPRQGVHASLVEAALSHDAIAIYESLEARIEAGQDTPEDRAYAHKAVSTWVERTAAYCFARAALAGRMAELRGLEGKRFVQEAERYARRSVELDPEFRSGAARRMLGTLYVLVPGRFVMHGNSETGLQYLEDLVAEHPEDARNHLRLGEAYVAFGDLEGAKPPLCRALARRADLRRDDKALLDRLVADAGGGKALACGG